jgi:hypothetical protein
MLPLIAQLLEFLRAPVADGGAHTRRLLACADHTAGRDPRGARELRRAALAAFRVVR